MLTPTDLPQVQVAIETQPKTVGRAAPTAAPPQTDPGAGGYLGRLITYIPGEVIAAYQVLIGLCEGNIGAQKWVGGLLVIATALWVAFATREPGEAVPIHQVINSTLAFMAWLYATKSPLVEALGLTWSAQVSALLLAGCVLLLFPLVEAIVKRVFP
ncbi:hypothetical protein [Sphingomonas sp. DBB INV C78]|uniref:hypothetical protein n=1 Tax=Sphingomonas sp. DBB INV C78 TaxID=3349434 RepID=UPI0036D3DF10